MSNESSSTNLQQIQAAKQAEQGTVQTAEIKIVSVNVEELKRMFKGKDLKHLRPCVYNPAYNTLKLTSY